MIDWQERVRTNDPAAQYLDCQSQEMYDPL